jgi:hypothetical protein
MIDVSRKELEETINHLESLQKLGGATLSNCTKAVLELIFGHPNASVTKKSSGNSVTRSIRRK